MGTESTNKPVQKQFHGFVIHYSVKCLTNECCQWVNPKNVKSQHANITKGNILSNNFQSFNKCYIGYFIIIFRNKQAAMLKYLEI